MWITSAPVFQSRDSMASTVRITGFFFFFLKANVSVVYFALAKRFWDLLWMDLHLNCCPADRAMWLQADPVLGVDSPAQDHSHATVRANVAGLHFTVKPD